MVVHPHGSKAVKLEDMPCLSESLVEIEVECEVVPEILSSDGENAVVRPKFGLVLQVCIIVEFETEGATERNKLLDGMV